MSLFFLSPLPGAGFAFVYFEDERDAEDAIRGLDNMPFGYDRRRLSVEWAKVIIGLPLYACVLSVTAREKCRMAFRLSFLTSSLFFIFLIYGGLKC